MRTPSIRFPPLGRIQRQLNPKIFQIRVMSTSTQLNSTPLNISSNSDPVLVTESVKSLVSETGGRWSLTRNSDGLEREFKFKTFKKTWEFMNLVAAEAARVKHHPEWSNVYNTTFIRWTTHHPPGLSHLDVQMAAFCDEQGNALGELAAAPVDAQKEAQSESAGMCSLTNRAVKAGGDCCVPKSVREGKPQ